jgi:glutaryl-CoA dehydrogenase (non-decarboxylating)
MKVELTSPEGESQTAFQQFARDGIAPHADTWDREERLPRAVIDQLAAAGYLGALIPPEYGGAGMSMLTFGLLNEEIGRACSSVRSLLTVHGMVQFAIARWGSTTQKALWLPRLASGATIGAFGLTEAAAGSDGSGIETQATLRDDAYVLHGTKRWTTLGQIANVFLIFARSERGVDAFLVERDRPGFSTTAVSGLLGTRASMLATLHLDGCAIPRENRIGGSGFGLLAVGASALDVGRYSVACGCVGIAQASLDASVAYASQRTQFGALLKNHQLIQQLITATAVNTSAARWLCRRAGWLKDTGDAGHSTETLMAKYFASKTAMQAAADAVQIHGANGCGTDYPVQRYFRDAKIMEIIEGSSQIQEVSIAREICAARERES